MNLRDYKTVKERRKAFEKELNLDLPAIGSSNIDDSISSTRNCENMIGYTQIPLGIAGPLKIIDKEYYVPLATTEGALVASVNRGCKAITQSGGVIVSSYHVGTTRGPVFQVKNLAESRKLFEFLKTNRDLLQTVAAKTSHHLTLKKVSSRGVGHYRYVRFAFDTQDAMGMNMVTIATSAMVTVIEKETGTKCIALAGNYDSDKKPSWLNFIENRGMKVWAEVALSHEVLTKILKTTPQKMYQVWLSKCMIGSAMAGSMGFNAQYANIIAALFAATGQDLGHIGECSVGITTAEIVNDGLYISSYLPDVMVGIVGGGTGLATQKEALSIIGVKTNQEFAEVIGASVLAGEISLLASLSEGTLAKSHQELARGGT